MKISRAWLQKYFDTPLPDAAVLSDALTFHAFEIEGMEKVPGDDVIDVKVTPNRGHDALSHRAIAKEIAAALSIPLSSDPLKDAPNLSPTTDAVSVRIGDTELCYRFTAGYIKGVKVGPSPEWLKERLEAIGQRSINNIVDATNFVMFNIGQPVHAFDARKLARREQSVAGGYTLMVRNAKDGERISALDGKEYSLKDTMLVVADDEGPLGIAGVKGGMASGIDETTTDIIIECANFNGVSVRKTSKALNLATDASQRFQQVISPELAAYGQRLTVDLILKIAGGELVGFADAYPKPVLPWQVSCTAAHTSKLLGIAVSVDEIKKCLTRLDLSFREMDGTFTVEIPVERLDLQIPEDLIEEIGRMIGYERIPSQELPTVEKPVAVSHNFAAAERVRKNLTDEGYSEVFTSVFSETGDVAVLNKVDGARPFLRATLTSGLSEALRKNVQNKDLLGLREVKLFEIGTVWKKGGEELMVGIISEKKAAAEESLSTYVEEGSAYEALPVSETVRYQQFSRYPSITRDIALWVPSETPSEDVKSVIRDAAGSLLIRIDQFDEFKKGERTSYAFRLVFQSFEKTLTDDEANGYMQEVYSTVKGRGWEVR